MRSEVKQSLAVTTVAVILALLAAIAIPTAAAAAECTNTYVGPSEGSWGTASNWSAGHLPTKSDVACIGAGKTVKDGLSGSTAGAVQVEGALSLTANSLELTGVAGSTIKTFTMAGGALKGPGAVTVTSSFTWTNGQMNGPGTTIIGPLATGTLIPPSTNRLNLVERLLVNEGELIMPSSPGAMSLGSSSVIENLGTFTINNEFSPAIEANASGTARIVNFGTFRKTTGAGTTAINVFFESSGMVAAESGNLRFNKGGAGSGGSWSASEGATISFYGGTCSLSGSTLSGRFVVYGGTSDGHLTLNEVDGSSADVEVQGGGILEAAGGKSTVRGLEINPAAGTGGSIKGSGTLTVMNSFSWITGQVNGPGTLILAPGASGTMAVTGSQNLHEAHFVNRGTLAYTSGEIYESGGSKLENQGTFIANSESTNGIKNGTGINYFVNLGTFKKTSGTGTTTVAPIFENYGSIREESGHVKLLHPIALRSSSHTDHKCKQGDPVECATGDLTEAQTDLAIPGRGIGLELTRSYSAQTATKATSAGSFGYGWTATFSDHLTSEEEGAKITLSQADGGVVTFTKNGTSWVAPSWSPDLLTGSSESGFILTLPDQSTYGFSGNGKLLRIADRNGNETTVTYDEAGRLASATDPGGRHLIFKYNGAGLVETVEDPLGHTVKYTYEGSNLTSVTMPGEIEPRWRFKYDTSHRLTSITDGRGGKTTNEYDSSSRVVSQVDPAGRKTTFEYGPFHTTITNKATGAVTDEWFNSNNQPFSVTHGFGTAAATTQTFGYDAAGRLLSATDGSGHTTTYGYDEAGDLTSERDPLGHETKWSYNRAHELVSTTTAGGETTTIKRDSNGNAESISRPAPGGETQTTTFAHDEHGQLESVTDPLGNTWSYGYDTFGDRVSETDPLGHEQATAYDADSRIVASTTPRGNLEGAEPVSFTTTIERDAQGRPVKVTDPLGNATKYAYDGNGNLASITDAKGHTTKYTYNADDERAKVEKPNGATTQTEYDGAGAITSQTNGNGKTTTYVRNVLEQPIEVVDPLGRKTLESFDAAGNLASLTDPAERKTSYSYDAAGRLTGINYSEEATPDASLEYDADGNVVAIHDGTGASAFTYDQLGRLTRSEDGQGEVVEHGYNLDELQTSIVYPNGKTVARAYDSAGRLERLTDWLGGTTSFGYDADSDLTSIAFPVESGNVDEYAYDRASRMSMATFKHDSETIASLGYVRDAVGQVEKEARSGLPGPGEVSYGYDQNNRLIEAGSEAFEYDAADNLTKANGSTNSYDAASQLETGNGVSYSYDKLGERIKAVPSSGPVTSYGYDQAGNLISVSRPAEGEVAGIAETLSYDATGLLVSDTGGLATQHFSWDQSSELPLLLADGSDSYVYGPNSLPIEQIDSGEHPSYLHHDQLGSTRLLTGEAGATSATFSYAPYGGLEAKAGSAKTVLGFAGQFTDSATGFQYLRARFYDPGTAQFLTKDPLVALTGAPYAYGRENPTRFIDPSGLACVEHFGPLGVYPNIIDCYKEVAEETVQSPLTSPAVAIACAFVAECTPVRAVIAGLAAATATNLLGSESNPCFNFLSHEIESAILLLAGESPGALVDAGAARAGGSGLTPLGERILHIVTGAPGIALDIVHSATGG